MADPITLSIIATAASAATSIAGGIATNQQEKANAAALNANAEEAGRTLASDDEAMERQQRELIGKTLTSVGANGVTLSGSALDVTMQNLIESTFDRLQARRDRVTQMNGLKYEAEAAKARGKQAMIGGFMSAAGSIAAGASDILKTSPAGGAGVGSAHHLLSSSRTMARV